MADRGSSARWAVVATAVLAFALLPAPPSVAAGATAPVDPLLTAEVTPSAPFLAAGPVHDPEVVERTVREVLERREYQPARRSLLQRIREEVRAWFAERIVGLFSGARGPVLAWFIVALGAAAAGFGLWRIIRRTGRDPGQDPEAVVAPRDRAPDEWWEDAARAQGRGDLTAAVRAAYHAVVAELAADGIVDGSDGSTIGEHRRDVASNAPGLARDFDDLAIRIDDVLYGPATASPGDVDRLRSLLPRSVVARS